MSLRTVVPTTGALLVGLLPNEQDSSSKFQYVLCRDCYTAEQLLAESNNNGVGTHFALGSFDANDLEGADRRTIHYPSQLTPLYGKAFCFDLDVRKPDEPQGFKYDSIALALKAASDAVSAGQIPQPTHVYKSGSGVYLYYVLQDEEQMDHAAWDTLRRRLLQAARVSDLMFDPGSMSGAGTMQRAPLGNNYKTGYAVPTQWIKTNDLAYTVLSLSTGLPTVDVIESTGQPEQNIRKVHWTHMIEACPRALLLETNGIHSEPDLFNFANVAHYLHEGEAHYHRLARMSARYDKHHAQTKYDHVGKSALSGPLSCGRFAETDATSACVGCQLRPYVRNPVDATRKLHRSLETLNKLDTDTTFAQSTHDRITAAPEGVTVAHLVEEFNKRQSTMMPVVTPEEPVVAPQPITESNMTATALAAAVDTAQSQAEDGGYETDINGTVMFNQYTRGRGGQPPTLNKILVMDNCPTPIRILYGELHGCHGVEFTNKKKTAIHMFGETESLPQFLTKYFKTVVHDKARCEEWFNYQKAKFNRVHAPTMMYEQTGLKPDGAFFTAHGMRDTDGTYKRPLELPVPNTLSQLLQDYAGERGTFDNWMEAIRVYSKTDDIPLLIPTLLAIATPLVSAGDTERFNSIYSLSGKSGTGKTTAMRFANSVWGKPIEFHTTASTSVVTTVRLCGELNGHMIVVDEVTRLPADKIQELAFDYSGGSEKNRSASSGNTGKMPLRFRGMMCVTTNNPIIDKLSEIPHDVSGSMSRIMEMIRGKVDDEDVDKFRQAEILLRQNYGVMGQRISTEVHQHNMIEQACEVYDKFLTYFDQKIASNRLPDQNARFKIRLAAMAMTGHKVATHIDSRFPHTTQILADTLVDMINGTMDKAQTAISDTRMSAEDFVSECAAYYINYQDIPAQITHPGFDLNTMLIGCRDRLYFNRQLMAKIGIRSSAGQVRLLRLWRDAGVLVTSNDSKGPKRRARLDTRFPVGLPSASNASAKNRPRMYALEMARLHISVGAPAVVKDVVEDVPTNQRSVPLDKINENENQEAEYKENE